jgi:hypothetical protein
MCVEADLVHGEELIFVSTKVRANAHVDSLASRPSLPYLGVRCILPKAKILENYEPAFRGSP